MTNNHYLFQPMSSSITITYTLNPPAGTQPVVLPTSQTHEFVVYTATTAGQKAYYAALHDTIAKAKDQIGNELTAWRDAVGKAELNKELKQNVKSDDEEESEEE